MQMEKRAGFEYDADKLDAVAECITALEGIFDGCEVGTKTDFDDLSITISIITEEYQTEMWIKDLEGFFYASDCANSFSVKKTDKIDQYQMDVVIKDALVKVGD